MKHVAGMDAAADVPRTFNKDGIAKDLAAAEVDEDNSTAGASPNNNVTGKAAATEISNTTPSKEDSILNPSTIALNTANMPPSINVSGANVAITNLPAIASPSAVASTTLTNHPSEVESKVILMGHPISCCHAPVVRSFFIHCKITILVTIVFTQVKMGHLLPKKSSCFDVISTSPVPSNHLLLSHPIKLS
jgi:hypothetical protein